MYSDNKPPPTRQNLVRDISTEFLTIYYSCPAQKPAFASQHGTTSARRESECAPTRASRRSGQRFAGATDLRE